MSLDLTDPSVQAALGIDPADLTSADRRVCQGLAQIAVAAGFEAIIGPSAAASEATTLAVFDGAILARSRDVADLGVRMPSPTPR